MDSLKFKVLNKFYPALVSCIEQSPKDIADRLRPSGILAPGDVEFLSNPNTCNDDKARRIVDVVLNQVQNDPQVYCELIKAMRASGNWTKAMVHKLEEAHTSLSADTNQCLPEGNSGKRNNIANLFSILVIVDQHNISKCQNTHCLLRA